MSDLKITVQMNVEATLDREEIIQDLKENGKTIGDYKELIERNFIEAIKDEIEDETRSYKIDVKVYID